MKNNTMIQNMDDRQLRKYRRELKLRRVRRNRMLFLATMSIVSVLFVLIISFTCGTLKSDANTGYKYYTSITVESGDSLWTIADDYMDTDHYKNKNKYIAEVCRINHLSEDGSIVKGQTLVVPYFSYEYVY